MNIHFIAIGGSAMHNLAIALHKKGYHVTGSDDEFFEPSKSRLSKYGLLPSETGWNANRINANIDAIVLGMHARADNPELLKAQQLGLKIYSYPEYLYEQSKNKTRVVIGGSHGKTSITAMILHVLNYHQKKFDYMVGAQLEGLDVMVQLSDDAPFIILEGDEYLSSPMDRRPKFHLYQPHIALLSGIAWDHINVFPTFENYVEQFKIFIDKIVDKCYLIYYEGDEHIQALVANIDDRITTIPYTTHEHCIKDGITYLIPSKGGKQIPLIIFGEHNLQNLQGAMYVCRQMGIDDNQFYEAIASFKGASKRLELVASFKDTALFKDFAHSPSKLKATINAVKTQFPNRKLVACMELHTFSSLNEQFLKEYHHSMQLADIPIVYFNPHTIAHKKLQPITAEQIQKAFGRSDMKVLDNKEELLHYLKTLPWRETNLLMMSSGNFDGINIDLSLLNMN